MLKIGIIGCGKITEVRHAPEYHENPACSLTAYYDADPARSQTMAALYGGKACSSVEELLAENLDAVSVCVANKDHAAVSIAALEAGFHVLCEKPMASTLEECLAMNAAAQKAGKLLMIGHNQRYARAHVKARELIARGEIGEILSFATTFGHSGPEGWTGLRNSWFFDKSRASFGSMADLGVHKTDLLHYLCGQRIVEVTATLQTLHKTFPDGSPITVDDNAVCLYKMENGAVGTMRVSWTFYGEEDNSTRIYGTGGCIRLYDHPRYALIVEKPQGENTYYELDKMTSNEEQTTGRRTSTGVIDAFVDSIQNGTPTVASGEEALKAMRVIFAAEESARTGNTIQVSED
ncbi:Gfo/Idh/MocA family oxidoreductase [Oscillospiraceae bacterium MB08-C2-2]|nr:Gfo/Idh/MocA family oxidoreductase [Oscillospiraceae bacterium MB08-C2-2]